jgi:splicing factor 45
MSSHAPPIDSNEDSFRAEPAPLSIVPQAATGEEAYLRRLALSQRGPPPSFAPATSNPLIAAPPTLDYIAPQDQEEISFAPEVGENEPAMEMSDEAPFPEPPAATAPAPTSLNQNEIEERKKAAAAIAARLSSSLSKTQPTPVPAPVPPVAEVQSDR